MPRRRRSRRRVRAMLGSFQFWSLVNHLSITADVTVVSNGSPSDAIDSAEGLATEALGLAEAHGVSEIYIRLRRRKSPKAVGA